MLKLFSCVQPSAAVFGKKDYQQLMILRRMARQFALPTQIVAAETVRADDGLALSSRNGYLSAAASASRPRRSFRDFDAHRGDLPDTIVRRDRARSSGARRDALASRGWRPDYVSIRQRADLAPPDAAAIERREPLVVLAAAWLGTTRLIDNLELP